MPRSSIVLKAAPESMNCGLSKTQPGPSFTGPPEYLSLQFDELAILKFVPIQLYITVNVSLIFEFHKGLLFGENHHAALAKYRQSFHLQQSVGGYRMMLARPKRRPCELGIHSVQFEPPWLFCAFLVSQLERVHHRIAGAPKGGERKTAWCLSFGKRAQRMSATSSEP